MACLPYRRSAYCGPVGGRGSVPGCACEGAGHAGAAAARYRGPGGSLRRSGDASRGRSRPRSAPQALEHCAMGSAELAVQPGAGTARAQKRPCLRARGDHRAQLADRPDALADQGQCLRVGNPVQRRQQQQRLVADRRGRHGRRGNRCRPIRHLRAADAARWCVRRPDPHLSHDHGRGPSTLGPDQHQCVRAPAGFRHRRARPGHCRGAAVAHRAAWREAFAQHPDRRGTAPL